MLKVITITSHTDLWDKDNKFVETEYPELNKYLASGYRILQTIPIIKPTDQSQSYAVIFILGK